ncbi:hypothetical protein L1987_43265 [Smallanthus sonchifolius]|uniref:Uncharacterized protein n=1 Tax=Smallanthus sonchifolius TaxID=185202 RepID=A0ACB9GM58_9ASTR|nr:hypothetical protein L1987_43265 [Smallanthus sonchifolius]
MAGACGVRQACLVGLADKLEAIPALTTRKSVRVCVVWLVYNSYVQEVIDVYLVRRSVVAVQVSAQGGGEFRRGGGYLIDGGDNRRWMVVNGGKFRWR